MANIGYIRVSSVGQNTARQLEGITLDRIFEDHASGSSMDRPALAECLRYLREGDTLHVHSMDRLSRSLSDLRALVDQLTIKGVTVTFVKNALTFTGKASPMQNMLLAMLGAVAEFERAMILERQAEGIAIAKTIPGKYKGRKQALSTEVVKTLLERVTAGEKITSLASEYGVSRETIYAYRRAAAPASEDSHAKKLHDNDQTAILAHASTT